MDGRDTTVALKAVVKRIVEENPLLTGACLKRSVDPLEEGKQQGVLIEAGWHCDFTVEVDGPKGFTAPPKVAD